MIFGKANLQVHPLTLGDKGLNIANNVHFAQDGSTVALSNKAMMVVSPLPASVSTQFPIQDDVSLPEKGFSTNAKNVKVLTGLIGNDTQFGGLLEQTAVTKVTEQSVEVTTTDGRKKDKIDMPIARQDYVEYKSALKAALMPVLPGGMRICVNRKQLIDLLIAMDKACPDAGGEAPVFIEIGEEVLLRARNDKTGQTAIGIMNQYDTDHWLERTQWEKKMMGIKKRSAKI